jgi:ribonuclease BN (tRNA processing enzyme)
MLRGRLLLLGLGLVALVASWFVVWAVWRYERLARDVMWLDERDFDTLTLTTAGTGSAYENPTRLGPVSAVGYRSRIVLVDAGRGVAEALRHCAIRTAQPDTLLLTSLLPENTVGIDDLLASGWLSERTQPLRVIGPPGTRALTSAVLAAQRPGLDAYGRALGLPAGGAELDVLEVGDGWSETRDGLTLLAGAVGGRPLPELAWRFEADGAALVVSGSGPDPDALAAFAKGAGLLVTEGFYRTSADLAAAGGGEEAKRMRREEDLHLDTEEAGAVAARAGVPALVLTRLRPPPLFSSQYQTSAGKRYDGRVVVASECGTYPAGPPP